MNNLLQAILFECDLGKTRVLELSGAAAKDLGGHLTRATEVMLQLSELAKRMLDFFGHGLLRIECVFFDFLIEELVYFRV